MPANSTDPQGMFRVVVSIPATGGMYRLGILDYCDTAAEALEVAAGKHSPRVLVEAWTVAGWREVAPEPAGPMLRCEFCGSGPTCSICDRNDTNQPEAT